MAKFPELVQSCILYEGDAKNFDAIIGLFLTATNARGWKFNQIERKPDLFYRLYGGPELMITVEKMAQPAAPEVFSETLNSPFTKLTAPSGRADISSEPPLRCPEPGPLSGPGTCRSPGLYGLGAQP